MVDPSRNLGHVDRDHRAENKDGRAGDIVAEDKERTGEKRKEGGEGAAGASDALRKSPGHGSEFVADDKLDSRPEVGVKQEEDCKDCA